MMAPDTWTPNEVWNRLVEAAGLATAIQVPAHWRPVPTPMSLPPADDIKHARETIGWLAWLKASDADLVWARAQGCRWKQICWALGLSRPTADRRRKRALNTIVARLNGRSTARATNSLEQRVRHLSVRGAGRD